MSTFPATLAIDENGILAPVGSVGQVFASSDTGALNPLDIEDLNGIPISGNQLVANAFSVIQSFRYNGALVVDWVSGDFRIPIVAGDQLPAGGATGQVLAKNSGTDYDTEWVTPAPAGGGGGTIVPGRVDYVRWKTGQAPGGRPTADPAILVFWVGPDPDPAIVTTGTAGMLEGDVRLVTP